MPLFLGRNRNVCLEHPQLVPSAARPGRNAGNPTSVVQTSPRLLIHILLHLPSWPIAISRVLPSEQLQPLATHSKSYMYQGCHFTCERSYGCILCVCVIRFLFHSQLQIQLRHVRLVSCAQRSINNDVFPFADRGRHYQALPLLCANGESQSDSSAPPRQQRGKGELCAAVAERTR